MQARMRYALRARITNIEQLQFTNTEYIDPFSGNPVEVMVPAILIMTTLHKMLDKSQARLYNTVGYT
jgi:hypothetical protein